MDYLKRLKKALDPDDPCLIGCNKIGKFRKKLLNVRKGETIHTSAILKDYSPLFDIGLIFETDAEPLAVIPMDIVFFSVLKEWFYLSYNDYIETISALRDEFVFESVKKMVHDFPTYNSALAIFKRELKNMFQLHTFNSH